MTISRDGFEFGFGRKSHSVWDKLINHPSQLAPVNCSSSASVPTRDRAQVNPLSRPGDTGWNMDDHPMVIWSIYGYIPRRIPLTNGWSSHLLMASMVISDESIPVLVVTVASCGVVIAEMHSGSAAGEEATELWILHWTVRSIPGFGSILTSNFRGIIL